MTTALTTLPELKTYLAVQGSQSDAILNLLITQCSAQIETYLSRTIGSAQYTEYFDGTSAGTLMTSQYPITAIAVLEINDQPQNAAVNVMGAGYRFFEREVILNAGAQFTRGRKNIKLTYTAGYTVIPPDLNLLVNRMIGNMWKSKDWLGFSSKSLAGETVSFKDEIDKPSNKAVLNEYKNVVPL